MQPLLVLALSALFAAGPAPVVAADTAARFGVKPTVTFEFNRTIAVKYAIVALEELDAKEHRNDFGDYDPNAPLLASMPSRDCEKIERNVVLVVFAHRKFPDRFAYVYLIQDKDKLLKIHIRGYQLAPAKTLLDLPASTDDFWACGV